MPGTLNPKSNKPPNYLDHHWILQFSQTNPDMAIQMNPTNLTQFTNPTMAMRPIRWDGPERSTGGPNGSPPWRERKDPEKPTGCYSGFRGSMALAPEDVFFSWVHINHQTWGLCHIYIYYINMYILTPL